MQCALARRASTCLWKFANTLSQWVFAQLCRVSTVTVDDLLYMNQQHYTSSHVLELV